MTPAKKSNATMTFLTYGPGIAIGAYFSMHCYLALQLNRYASELIKRKPCDIFDEDGKVCSARVKELRLTQSPDEAPYEDSGKVHESCKKTIAQRNILANMEPFIGFALFPSFWKRQIKEIEEASKHK